MGEATKKKDRKKYVLQVQRDGELSLRRPEEICNEESIMRPSYEKAMRALTRIMRQTKRFHENNNNSVVVTDIFSLENELFGYSGNIIAFAAPRGGGKTATMLSFSRILNEGFGEHSSFKNTDNSFLNVVRGDEKEKPDVWLRRSRFISMTPIAPAILEGEQNILYVVLSRLYRYAERLITERSRLNRIQEAEKNQIIRSFQKALSGINGIKHPEKKYPGDLIGMQDVCDGMSLSRHFYDLVQRILKLEAGDRGISDRYLVIQLDDADSKMQRVYEVLEDVRKYLMIPNLVILMSVDQKCMSDVVFQDNLRCFPDLISIDQKRLSHDLSKITNKYIDKLIPPTHMVQLPQLDQIVVHWDDMLRLQYVDEDKNDVYAWMTDEMLDLQNALLMLIYRKTHILFVKPPHYLHNMIPRTLRGFNQLLELLDSMEDVPEITGKMFESVKAYAQAVLKQSEIAAINQRRFTDYFKSRWISAKITDLEDLEFLRKFADTVSANRIRLAVKHLRKKYNQSKEEIRERHFLDYLMWYIEQEHRAENDFRLMFAIRTLLTMDSHQHILKEKRKVVRDYLDKVQANKNVEELEYLLFDLSPDEMWIPNILWLDKAVDEIIKEVPAEAENVEQYEGLLTPLLMLGNPDYKDIVISLIKYFSFDQDNNDTKNRKRFHQMQELAVMLYGNSDVSCAVMNYLKDNVGPRKNQETKEISIEERLIVAIMKQIDGFNDGYLKSYVVNGGATIDQEAGTACNESIQRAILHLNSLIRKKNNTKEGQLGKETDKTEETVTALNNDAEDELKQQGPNPEKRPKVDRGKAMHNLDD